MNPSKTFDIAKRIAHIVTWFGDPVLRTVCEDIHAHSIMSDDTQKLIDRLIYSMREIQSLTGLGKGLAAPQIGELKRVFVVFHDEEYKAFINPKITKFYNEQNIYPEMCLSGFPLAASVKRPSIIDVEYYDREGNLNQITTKSIFARVIQHELDHLDGILFIDRAELNTIEIVSNLDRFKEKAKLIDL